MEELPQYHFCAERTPREPSFYDSFSLTRISYTQVISDRGRAPRSCLEVDGALRRATRLVFQPFDLEFSPHQGLFQSGFRREFPRK